MAINFPSSPALNQVFINGNTRYIWNGTYWVASKLNSALPFNYLINSSFQVSNQNGNTAGSSAPGFSAYYVADQWAIAKNHGSGVITPQRVLSITPKGSAYRLRATVNTADATLTADEYLVFLHNLEGFRIESFLYGLSIARQVIVCFGFRGPAGKYAVAIRNYGGTRSYLAEFTITAGQSNIDTEQVVVVPGDVTGTWPKDNSKSMEFNVTVAAGTTYQGVAGWQASNRIGTATTSNGIGTTGNVFELFDVGMYLDPYGTGRPPVWEATDHHLAFMDSLRYWCKNEGLRGVGASTTINRGGNQHIVKLRAAPAFAIVGAPTAWDAVVSYPITGIANGYANTHNSELSGNTSGAMSGSACFMPGNANDYIAANARM